MDDVASGILGYLAGVKANREEHERRQREWERRQRLAALARAREERETRRGDFLKRLVATSKETDELKLLVVRLRDGLAERPTGELARLLEWADARLERLEGELTPEGLSTALEKRELFPEIDHLSDAENGAEYDL